MTPEERIIVERLCPGHLYQQTLGLIIIVIFSLLAIAISVNCWWHGWGWLC